MWVSSASHAWQVRRSESREEGGEKHKCNEAPAAASPEDQAVLPLVCAPGFPGRWEHLVRGPRMSRGQRGGLVIYRAEHASARGWLRGSGWVSREEWGHPSRALGDPARLAAYQVPQLYLLHVGKREVGPQNPCRAPYSATLNGAWGGRLLDLAGSELKMKADLLAEKGGKASTLSNTLWRQKKKKRSKRIAAWLVFRDCWGDGPSGLPSAWPGGSNVSGFIVTPVGWNGPNKKAFGNGLPCGYKLRSQAAEVGQSVSPSAWGCAHEHGSPALQAEAETCSTWARR